MPPATPAERILVLAYLSAGSTKGAACALGKSEGNYRARLSKAYRRHGVRNITELSLRVLGEDVPNGREAEVALVEY